MSKSPTVRASWLGNAPYRAVWDLQAEMVSGVRGGSAPDTLLLLEHPHVFTLGKAGGADDLLWNEDERGRREVDVIWSDREKVAAIGIKLNRSVVSHGFALNLTTDLDYFDGIVPCGHPDKRPTSVAALRGLRIDTGSAAREYRRHFERVFGTHLTWATPESMI